jgi:TatD DNase family protein
MWIDTHCHLDAAEFSADRDAVAAAAVAAGVTKIVVPAVEVANFAAVRQCCQRYPGCLPAYGIHPMYTPQATDADLDVLRDWLQRERPVAVGEIGLDHFVEGLDPARQLHLFVEQLKLAREFDLPVLLHVRRAVDPILRELRRIGVRGGIAHAFNGSRQQAEMFISDWASSWALAAP